MNIFNDYLEKIKETILNLSQKGELILPDQLDGITAEIPPQNLIAIYQQMLQWFYLKLTKKLLLI